jgi:hypothetical protein
MQNKHSQIAAVRCVYEGTIFSRGNLMIERVPVFLKTRQFTFSIKDIPLTQSLSQTAQLIQFQIMVT